MGIRTPLIRMSMAVTPMPTAMHTATTAARLIRMAIALLTSAMDTERTLSAPALLRLMQLVSPVLPIGGYNFSQGLEYAIEAGWVHNEQSALAWIRGLARSAIGTLDIPVLIRLHAAWTEQGDAEVRSRFL